ncbi:hypothetical protein BC628DRAFT_1369102 [Trametes gibbosa]|nr:hypothetical protein BC628DRAFT_1369102 [Trametes gibbosa]
MESYLGCESRVPDSSRTFLTRVHRSQASRTSTRTSQVSGANVHHQQNTIMGAFGRTWRSGECSLGVCTKRRNLWCSTDVAERRMLTTTLHGQPKFAIFDIVLGTIYSVACAIEVFGVVAATMQRLALVRIYAMLSLVGSLAVIGAGFLRVIIHFVFKSGLIDECEKIAEGQGVEIRFGIWFHHFKEKLTPAEAQSFCNDAWNRDSVREIIFLIFEIILSIFFTMIAFAYYQQVLDPTSAANVSRAPVPTTALDGYPDHYNRPYDSEPYDAPAYAPPPGPPPPADMGYGVGVGMGGGESRDVKDRDAKDGAFRDDAGSETTKFDDPFADFDAASAPVRLPEAHAAPAYHV